MCAADASPVAKPDGPKLTKNQQTMFSLLHGTGAAGLTTERWNELARNEGLGVNRKADLYDIRCALKSKGLARQYGDRWNVCASRESVEVVDRYYDSPTTWGSLRNVSLCGPLKAGHTCAGVTRPR